MARASFAIFLACILLAVCFCQAQQKLPLVSSALGSHMVLQRAPQSAVLWGWTQSAAEQVDITFNGQNLNTVSSGSDNSWSIALPPTEASSTGQQIVVKTSEETVTLDDVLFGDVYICGGQSNMQMTLIQTFDADAAIADADNYPNVRIYTVGDATTSDSPLADFATVSQPWVVASNSSVGGGKWTYFSGACWYFVKDLYDSQQIPIGAVSSNWGGTLVEAWSSPDALAACPSSETEKEHQLPANPHRNPAQPKTGGPDPNTPSVLYNAMINPLLPMRVRGAIWYQGEANVGNAYNYLCRFPAMIADWRAKFGLDAKDFGFYLVQLAAYLGVTPGQLPDLRLSQQYAEALPYVGMATAIDLGDPSSPDGNIHPRNKSEVGRRLSLLALDQLYGESVVSKGPVVSHAVSSNIDGSIATITISFVNDSSSKLVLIDTPYCPSGVGTGDCRGVTFEVGTTTGIWIASSSAVLSDDGSSVIITADLRSPWVAPTSVRYGYDNYPVLNLFNDAGLPAYPFNINLYSTV